MIVVIVAEQDDIDAREILPSHAGRTVSPRADPLQRARARRPDRIGKNVHVAELKHDRRVVDHRDSQFAIANRGVWFALLDVVDETRRLRGPASELPAQESEEAAHLRSTRIEESFPVEMFRKYVCFHPKLHSGLFDQLIQLARIEDLPRIAFDREMKHRLRQPICGSDEAAERPLQ